MIQLLCHLWGDYILQSDWMAQNKTKASLPCLIHVTLYAAGFLLLRPSWKALAVIAVTHFFIDRYRLARYVVWVKNWMGPRVPWYFVTAPPAPVEAYWTDVDEGKVMRAGKWPMPPLSACPTGYPPNRPPWMAVWLLIVADNTLHLTINALALRFL